MAKKNKVKPNKEFRKESRKKESLLYTLIGIAALALAVLIVFVKNLDTSSCVGDSSAIEEEKEYEPSPSPIFYLEESTESAE